MIFTKYVSLFAIAGCFSLTTFAQTKVDIPLGKQFKITNRVETSTSSEMAAENTMEMVVTTLQEAKLISNKGEVQIIAVTNKNMSGEISMMGSSEKFNSDDETQGNFQGMTEEFEKGKISYYSINKKNGVSLPTDVNGVPTKADVTDKETNEMGGLEMQTNLKLVKILPANVKVGDSFKDTTTLNDMKLFNSYTVSKIENNQIFLDASFTANGVKTVDMGGQSFDTNSDGSGWAKYIVDKKTSILSRSELELTLNTNISMGSESIQTKSVTKLLATIE